MISPSGMVTTIAGTGQPGFQDGFKSDGAKFSSPSGIAVWRDWKYHNDGRVVLFVADTGNHRIRRLDGKMHLDEKSGEKKMTNVTIECFSGYCNKTPQAGFADGDSNTSRFDSPIGITVSSTGNIFITDTNNNLIRVVDSLGEAKTLAGTLVLAEVNSNGGRLEGCPDPCLTGSLGHKDGDLLNATFTFPTGVALSPDEKSLLITNRHYLRSVNMHLQSVKTLAGGNRESERDGQGSEASFNKPSGIAITNDGFAYIVDSASCRIRRAAVPKLFVPTIQCTDKVGQIFRPSGCSSYNAKIDQHGLKVTHQSGNIQYNYLYYNWTNIELGEHFIGRNIKDCVGSPPQEQLDRMNWNDSTLVIDNGEVNMREDPNEGSLVQVACRANCSNTDFVHGIKLFHQGNPGVYLYRYTAESSICMAAIHAGLIKEDTKETFLDVTLHRPVELVSSIRFRYSENTGEQLMELVPDTSYFFSVQSSRPDVVVQTISGAPAALRGKSCGYIDSAPAQEAKVRNLSIYLLSFQSIRLSQYI